MKPTWSKPAQAGHAHRQPPFWIRQARSQDQRITPSAVSCPPRHGLEFGSNPVSSCIESEGGRMPEHRPLQPASPWVRGRRHRRRLGRRRPRAAAHDLRPAGVDPGVRAVRARARRRRADPRPGALQHRPGGRRGRLGARADQRGLGQRLAPRPPPVPGQGAAPRRAQGPRPAGARRATTSARCCCARWPRSAASTAAGRHGRGGSMHLQWKEAGAMGTNAIVGGGVPAGGRLRLVPPARRHRRGRR